MYILYMIAYNIHTWCGFASKSRDPRFQKATTDPKVSLWVVRSSLWAVNAINGCVSIRF